MSHLELKGVSKSYGKTEVLAALEKACAHGAYHYEYIENIIQQRRQSEDHARAAFHLRAKNSPDIRLEDIDMSQYHLYREDDDEQRTVGK